MRAPSPEAYYGKLWEDRFRNGDVSRCAREDCGWAEHYDADEHQPVESKSGLCLECLREDIADLVDTYTAQLDEEHTQELFRRACVASDIIRGCDEATLKRALRINKSEVW